MEIKKLIKTYKIYMQCPQCKKGMMVCEDSITPLMKNLFGEKVLFTHICNECKHKEEYKRVYPYEEIEEIEI